MQASKQDRGFYWTMIDKIQEKLSKDKTLISRLETHDLIKYRAELDGYTMSPNKPNSINHEQLQELKEEAKHFATDIGLKPDEFEDYDKNK
jgi:hypothetical protein